ncbi:hypothetical protein [Paenibacillus sp. 453mf]|uniref:hypothetical protein n=1 Tax=Paenibacillus sp. 453mf TaxID=1761874 RepID=UPI0008EC787A|nr:hypothetical protein [Paenibacillus sp. 453mf]SFS61960.1 hypothetical protein SAMN04488601_1012769 [Paenibacillus sp. 453mf]
MKQGAGGEVMAQEAILALARAGNAERTDEDCCCTGCHYVLKRRENRDKLKPES